MKENTSGTIKGNKACAGLSYSQLIQFLNADNNGGEQYCLLNNVTHTFLNATDRIHFRITNLDKAQYIPTEN